MKGTYTSITRTVGGTWRRDDLAALQSGDLAAFSSGHGRSGEGGGEEQEGELHGGFFGLISCKSLVWWLGI